VRHKALTALAAVPAAVIVLVAGQAATAGSGLPPGCTYVQTASGLIEVCSTGGGQGGSPGGPSGGGHTTVVCTFSPPLTKADAAQLGLPWPPPKGDVYEYMTCPGGGRLGFTFTVQLVSTATGRPAIRPVNLLQTAMASLVVPALSPATAPPRGKDGLVGLPEWFWIPRPAWQPVSAHVTAGLVWLTATAVPAGLTISPGGGLSPVSCAGPGTAYDPRRPASTQHSTCSYTYAEPSNTQPGGRYQATVTVIWKITWVGSDGSTGVVTNGMPVTVPLAIPVAQSEALVTRP
jgi:hypothetical protein